jgi:hypothetical protein
MYELSPNLTERIAALVKSEPVSDSYVVYTLTVDGEEVEMTGHEVNELRKENAEISNKALNDLFESRKDADEKLDVGGFDDWYKENVASKLKDIETTDHEFDSDGFKDAANAYYKETLAVRAQFKDEIIAHYGLEDNEDADLWIMQAGGEGIPTLNLSTVIQAFDDLADSSDDILEA